MKKKGRKPILNEKEARKLVDMYIIQYGVSTQIRYIDLHNFCVKLFQEQKIKKLPSESFWRKKDRFGRKIIDEINSSLIHEIGTNDNNELRHLLNIIENKIVNKEVSTTISNAITSKQNKIEQLEEQIRIKEKELFSLKESYDNIQKMNKQQQELITQTFHYFLKRSSSDNMSFFNSALDNIFSQPLNYLTQLKQDQHHNQTNISDYFKNRLK